MIVPASMRPQMITRVIGIVIGIMNAFVVISCAPKVTSYVLYSSRGCWPCLSDPFFLKTITAIWMHFHIDFLL